MSYALTTEIAREHGFNTVEQKLRELMEEQGFGVLTEINVKDVMKEKLDLDKRPYKIIGFCSPPRANKVLESDGDVGLFLPCNGVIYDTGEVIRIALTNADTMFNMIDNESIAPVAKEVSDIFNAVKADLESHFN